MSVEKILEYRLPVAIISYNRPRYLRSCLKSLESQTDLEDTEFIFFQDGVSDKRILEENLKLFNDSLLPNKTVMCSDSNLGVAFNHQRAYEECFISRDRNAMIVSEDDIVYNPDWMRVTKILMRQFQNDQSVATVQASCRSGRTDNSRRNIDYNIVKFGKPNWLGFAIWRDRWKKMMPLFEKYLDVIRGSDYKNRNNDAIRKWYKDTIGVDEGMTSQDRAKEWSCILSGMGRAYTAVNRAVYVGENGVHGTVENYRLGGYADMVNDRIPGDIELQEFVVGGKFKKPSDFTDKCLKNKAMAEDND